MRISENAYNRIGKKKTDREGFSDERFDDFNESDDLSDRSNPRPMD